MADEPFDAAKVAAECKAKIGKRAKKGEAPAPLVVEEMPKAVRPEFDPKMVEQAKRLCQYGATIPEVADFFEVKKATFERWMQKHPELEEAVRLGSAPANERAKLSLYAQAVGYDYVEQEAMRVRIGSGKDMRETIEVVEVRKHMPANYSAAALFLTNKVPEEFRHRKTTDHTGEVVHKVTPAKAREELARWMKGEAAPTSAEAAPKPH